MPETPPPSPPAAPPAIPLARIAVILVIYLVLNGVSLFAPRVPDITVCLIWGFLFPVLAVLQTWLWFARSGRKYGEGLVAAIMMSVIFVLAALGTINICQQIHGAV